MECKQELKEKMNIQIDAFQYKFDEEAKDYKIAFQEAYEWMNLGFFVETENLYSRQCYVILTLSIEMFFKCILLKNKIKVPEIHNLKKLFFMIPKDLQLNIINSLEIHELPIIDKNNRVIKKLSTFYDYIDYINRYFIELRYDYEKIICEKITTVPILFINDLSINLFNICKSVCKINI